jgi:DNA-binding IclR family transcriptional regulator
MVKKKFKPVKALRHGLRLIEAISRKKEGMSLKELAGEIGCSSAAAYHLVHTLAEGGYVRRLESPARYVLGDGLLRLVENQGQDRFYEVTREAMRDLVGHLPGATIYLSEYLGGSVVVRGDVSFSGLVRDGGMRALPPYTSAGSLVHLAFWPPDIREEYQTRYTFESYGLPFWGSVRNFERALESLREGGFFWMPKCPPLAVKLALPVFRPGGCLAAALTVQGNPTEGWNPTRDKKRLIALTREAGASITRKLSL